jgi:LytS/YehU family sensor histidine kinase
VTMRSQPPKSPRFRHWLTAALVCTVNSVIAVALLLSLHGSTIGLFGQLLISNAIGFVIWGLLEAMQSLSGGRIGMVPALLLAVPAGIVLGGKAAALFGQPDFIGQWIADPLQEWKSIGIAALFAVAACAFIIVSSHAAAYRLELEIEQRRRAEASRSQAVAELGLLQAQIEPHFLFNTLAHVQSAIDQDPAIGKHMLEHLIRYLRGTLSRSRSGHYTLLQERELIESLLTIASLRMGPRLRSRVNMLDTLSGTTLPPLLLQPLVENAIKHGIEPAIDGGEISVDAECIGATLVLRVTDTGVGMDRAGPEGVGLSNVRARLAALYGEQGRLTLHPHPSRGVIAELRLPMNRPS